MITTNLGKKMLMQRKQRQETQRQETQRPETQRPETQRQETQRPETQRPETQRHRDYAQTVFNMVGPAQLITGFAGAKAGRRTNRYVAPKLDKVERDNVYHAVESLGRQSPGRTNKIRNQLSNSVVPLVFDTDVTKQKLGTPKQQVLRKVQKWRDEDSSQCQEDFSTGSCKVRLAADRLVRYDTPYEDKETRLALTSLSRKDDGTYCSAFCMRSANIGEQVSIGLSRALYRLGKDQLSVKAPAVLNRYAEKKKNWKMPSSTSLELYALPSEDDLNDAKETVKKLTGEVQTHGPRDPKYTALYTITTQDPRGIVASSVVSRIKPLLKFKAAYGKSGFRTDLQWGQDTASTRKGLGDALKGYWMATHMGRYADGIPLWIKYTVEYPAELNGKRDPAENTRMFGGVGYLKFTLKKQGWRPPTVKMAWPFRQKM